MKIEAFQNFPSEITFEIQYFCILKFVHDGVVCRLYIREPHLFKLSHGPHSLAFIKARFQHYKTSQILSPANTSSVGLDIKSFEEKKVIKTST